MKKNVNGQWESNGHVFDLVELSNLFHVAATALSRCSKRATRYDQRRFAAKEYAKRHPGVSSMAAYKVLEREDAWRY